MSHIVHEAGNNLTVAARQYELFKYMNRFMQAARQAGIDDARTRFFERMGAYPYRANREAHAGGLRSRATGPGSAEAIRLAEGRASAGRRSTDDSPVPFASDPSSQPVTDTFLNSLMAEFQTTSDAIMLELRQRAFATPAGSPSLSAN
jgi:hypothetical protein